MVVWPIGKPDLLHLTKAVEWNMSFIIWLSLLGGGCHFFCRRHLWSFWINFHEFGSIVKPWILKWSNHNSIWKCITTFYNLSAIQMIFLPDSGLLGCEYYDRNSHLIPTSNALCIANSSVLLDMAVEYALMRYVIIFLFQRLPEK